MSSHYLKFSYFLVCIHLCRYKYRQMCVCLFNMLFFVFVIVVIAASSAAGGLLVVPVATVDVVVVL